MKKKLSHQLNKFSDPVYSVDELLDVLLTDGDDSLYDLMLNDKLESKCIRMYGEEGDENSRCVMTQEDVDHHVSSKTFYDIQVNTWLSDLQDIIELDLLVYLLSMCKTDVQKQRVKDEYKLYVLHHKVMVIRVGIMLVNHFKKNKILWGVGRGSCVSSYILYLIGLHKIDSIEYELDINEMFK